MFFWFNETYREYANNKGKIQMLSEHKDQPVDTAYILDTMFDLAGVDPEKRKGKTLISKEILVEKRTVKMSLSHILCKFLFTDNPSPDYQSGS